MKHNHNHYNLPSAGPQLVPVRFEFTDPMATTVCVAGTFNRWQPEAKTLHPTGGGRWWKETALAPGLTNTAWWWMADGSPIPWPEKLCPTRSAEKTPFSRWPARRKHPLPPPQINRWNTQINKDDRRT